MYKKILDQCVNMKRLQHLSLTFYYRNKEKIKHHLCAFVVFVACLATVVILLLKNKNKDEMVQIIDDTFISSIIQTNNNITVLNSKIFFPLHVENIFMFLLIDNQTEIPRNSSSVYWIRDASLMHGRSNHEAVLLANGQVMVGSGRLTINIIIQTCEFYSSSIGWVIGSVMKNPRFYYTLTSFANNTKVLATGSAIPSFEETAEVYDSINNRWTATSTNMTQGRFAHGAALLKNEQILIIGGRNSSGFTLSSTEFFIPFSNSFINTNDLNIGRYLFTTTLLNDQSTVLVTGGGDTNNRPTSTAEVYRSGSWMLTNNMIQPRVYHAAVLLKDGNVLVAGGGNGKSISYSTAEIYNTTTHSFTAVQSMKYRRALLTLTLLPSGRVLASGGVDWTTNTYVLTCELYNPMSQTWSTTRTLNNGRVFHRSVLLNDSVLTIGGDNPANGQSGTCEKYNL